MKIHGQTIQDLTGGLQGFDAGEDRSQEIAAEVAILIDAVESFSEFMTFDSEPLQFNAYIAQTKVDKA